MITATAVHPEGPRYAAPLVYLPGLWVGPGVWRRAAGHLGHRGWEGTILDLRGVAGGIQQRAAAVAEHLRSRAAPPVFLGYDVGAVIALAAAAVMDVRALVLVSPLRPGAPTTHALTWSRGLVWSLFRRGSLPVPGGAIGEAFLARLPPDLRDSLRGEDARLLGGLARRSPLRRPASLPPTLVVHAADDPLVPVDEARRLAAGLGAEVLEAPGRGHWPLTAGAWQQCVDRVHRWLVQRLGEELLELYGEAMADRDEDER
jgi:pimeloyl-ACP methyl ester carboxylesterase